MISEKADIVIIGGGVIGLSVAYYAASTNASILLIEKNTKPIGSSYGNAGLIVPSHCKPLCAPGMVREGLRHLLNPNGAFSIRFQSDPRLIDWIWRFYRFSNEKHFYRAIEIYRELMSDSLALHRELAEKAKGAYEYAESGLLHLFLRQDSFEKGRADAEKMEKCGIVSNILSGDDTRDIDPAISRNVVGAIQHRPDGKIDPGAFLDWLKSEVESKGVRIVTEAEVFGFEHRHRHIEKIHSTKGEFKADQVVLAPGASLAVLARKLGRPVPLQGAKGYSLTFDRPMKSPAVPLMLEDFYVAVTTYRNRLRMTGFLELSGTEENIDLNRLKVIQTHTHLYLPELKNLKLQEVWRGHRPCTPDGLPVVGRFFENVWIAGGHATKGMTLGPVTGKIMADMISGGTDHPAAEFLKPNRF